MRYSIYVQMCELWSQVKRECMLCYVHLCALCVCVCFMFCIVCVVCYVWRVCVVLYVCCCEHVVYADWYSPHHNIQVMVFIINCP